MKKYFFKLVNNVVFGNTIEIVRKYRDIEIVAHESKRNYLVTERHYHITIFLKKFSSHRNEKKKQHKY